MDHLDPNKDLLSQLAGLNAQELKRLLVEHLTKQKLGLYWESNSIKRDEALNANVVLPQLITDLSCTPEGVNYYENLIIEGDNFDSLRLLKATHAGKIRVIYIDPPYNTGNSDWVYNDQYVGKTDRWRHSQWLEFLYQRLTLARDLLTSDGVILVSINDTNRSRLELLMDEVFPKRRVGSFVWRVRSGGNDTKGALLSDNHEHVLVYANAGFEFNGEGRNESAYSNTDNDDRGDWQNDNLVKAHNAKQRPEAYYHFQNPETKIWYLCDPDSVWRFSSTTRPLKKKLQADPMETIIAEKRVLWPQNDKTVTYPTLAAIEKSIKDGSAPKQLKIYTELVQLAKLASKDEKIARLISYIEPLENWVGRTIGYGKPRYKRFRKDLLRDVKPLSSWLHSQSLGLTEEDEDDDVISLTVGATGEGTAMVKEILGNKDFPYPKPLSLMKGLLRQATRRNDIVLDFFAGSGSTGHAVIELNAEDDGNRRFILCSSTEATKKEPDINVCRDICAERIRRVINGYSNVTTAPDAIKKETDFAYLITQKIAAADLAFEATTQQTSALISMRETGGVAIFNANASIQIIGFKEDWLIVVCTVVSAEILKELHELATAGEGSRLAIFCPRPNALAAMLQEQNIGANTYSLSEALLQGQSRAVQIHSSLQKTKITTDLTGNKL
jgi:adenine-specific DNA-methyltransferase